MRFSRFVSLSFLAFAATAAAALPVERENIPDAQVSQWVEKRVTEWQPKPSERRFDEIGWVKDLRTARQLAAKHNRPVFIFTMDGRINIGRC